MPKEKTAPTAEQSPEKTLALLFENIERQRAWFRKQRNPGQQLGHIVIGEMMLSLFETALERALEGKRWEEPAESP